VEADGGEQQRHNAEARQQQCAESRLSQRRVEQLIHRLRLPHDESRVDVVRRGTQHGQHCRQRSGSAHGEEAGEAPFPERDLVRPELPGERFVHHDDPFGARVSEAVKPRLRRIGIASVRK
jgi:hypothetical protein